jgi:hypothetical protein
MKVPEWVDLVKSARFKELAPYDEDWYYTRCAALARHIYFRSPVGVGAVTKIFGGENKQGVQIFFFLHEVVAQKEVNSVLNVASKLLYLLYFKYRILPIIHAWLPCFLPPPILYRCILSPLEWLLRLTVYMKNLRILWTDFQET